MDSGGSTRRTEALVRALMILNPQMRRKPLNQRVMERSKFDRDLLGWHRFSSFYFTCSVIVLYTLFSLVSYRFMLLWWWLVLGTLLDCFMMVEDEVLCRYGFAVAQNVSFRQILQMIQCVDEVTLLKISISAEIGGIRDYALYRAY